MGVLKQVLLQLVNVDDDNDDDGNDESLQAKNEALKASLEACRSELFEVYEQVGLLLLPGR